MEAALGRGSLRRPSAAAPSFVDLVSAVHRGAGVDVQPSRFCDVVSDQLFARRHLALVLVDGMGMSALANAGVAELGARVRLELDSVFPATTACAMTTVATGRWPAQHGIPGWHAYLAERELSATVLPFLERHTGRRLRRLGVQAAEIWPLPSRFAEVTGNMEVHVPLVYLLSTFNRYLNGRCKTRGYRSLRQAQRRILRRLQGASRRRAPRTITYWYIPDYDSACHTTASPAGRHAGRCSRFRRSCWSWRRRPRTTSVVAVTADHGLIDLGEGESAPLFPGDPLLDCLRCPPSGEARTPHFHVQPGKEAELVQRVTDLAGDRLALLSQGEAEELRLFGPEPLSDLARRRFGDYVGIALASYTLGYYESSDATSLHHVGVHGGMCPAEVRIPLVIL